MRRPPRRPTPAACEPLARRLLLSADPPTTYGVYPLAPAAGLTGVLNVAPATPEGTVYFTATRAGTPTLWRTDGTPQGTAAVVPLPGGYASPDRTFGTAVPFADHSLLYADGDPSFLATDGTAAGTALVGLPVAPIPGSAVAVGDDVFFAGRTDTLVLDPDGYDHHDVEHDSLWRTDGTAAGTVRLSDARPLAPTAAGGRLVFFTSGTDGLALWTSDGTPAGTVEQATVDAAANAPAPVPAQVATAGGTVFFVLPDAGPTATGTLWATDGTAGGTRPLTDALLYEPYYALFAPGGRPVYDGARLDAVDPTTGAVTDLLAASPDAYYADGAGLTASGRLLFLPRPSPSATAGWWTTDGTPAGTGPVGTDPSRAVPPASAAFADAVPFAGGLAMTVTETVDTPATADVPVTALYYADATAADARTLAGPDTPGGLFDPTGLSAAARGLVFAAAASATDPEPQLWAVGTDGIVAAAAATTATGPTATLVPAPAGAPAGTFAVAFTDPVGFTPVTAAAVAAAVAVTPVVVPFPQFDVGGTSNTSTAGPVPVAYTLTATALSEGGRTVVATFGFAPAAGQAYRVDVYADETGLTDTAGRPLAAGGLGFLGGPPRPGAATPATAVGLASAATVVAGTSGTATVPLPFSDVYTDGTFGLTLVLTPSAGQLGPADPVVATVPRADRRWFRRRHLLPSGRVGFTVPAGTPAGTYHLAAVFGSGLTGSTAGDVFLDGPSVTVAAAAVDLTIAAAGRSPLRRPGRRAVVRVRVTNNGTVAADGRVTVSAAAGTTAVGSVTRTVDLPPGRSVVVPVPVRVPAGLPAGDEVTATLSPDPALDDVDGADKRIDLGTVTA